MNFVILVGLVQVKDDAYGHAATKGIKKEEEEAVILLDDGEDSLGEDASLSYDDSIGYNPPPAHVIQPGFQPILPKQPGNEDSSVPTTSSTKRQQAAKITKRSVQCEMCYKILPSRAHLKIHFRVHTGDKPFKCNVCGRGFNQKGNLCRHLTKVHNIQNADLWTP